jgi:hypothetical protein
VSQPTAIFLSTCVLSVALVIAAILWNVAADGRQRIAARLAIIQAELRPIPAMSKPSPEAERRARARRVAPMPLDETAELPIIEEP